MSRLISPSYDLCRRSASKSRLGDLETFGAGVSHFENVGHDAHRPLAPDP
jgi:hypothetical protein